MASLSLPSKSIPGANQVPQIPISLWPYFSGPEKDSGSNKEEIEIPGCVEDSISESLSHDEVDNNYPNFEIITGGS